MGESILGVAVGTGAGRLDLMGPKQLNQSLMTPCVLSKE